MKIAIIGASGNIGSKITEEALSRNHDVTAIMRNPENLTIRDEHLVIKKGDVQNVDEIADIITGHDAVVVSFSPGWGPTANYKLHVDVAKAVIAAAKKAGVKRLINVGGAGSLEVAPGVQAVDTEEFPDAWKEGASAQRDSLEVYEQEKELDWTFFSPAFIIEPGERSGKFTVGTNNPVFNEKGESRISYHDYALALLEELEHPQFIRKRFTVGY